MFTAEIPLDEGVHVVEIVRRNGKQIVIVESSQPIRGVPSLHLPSECDHASEFEMLSGDRLQWNGITCHLSESQAIAMRSILDGDGSFASLGETIYGDELADKSLFYDIAKGLRKKFARSGILREIRPANQRLVILPPKK